MSLSQILVKDYQVSDAFTIIIEMTDMLCRKLRNSNKITSRITLYLKYSRELNDGFSISKNIDATSNQNIIIKEFKKIYLNNVKDLPIRKLGIIFSNLDTKTYKQLNIFDNNKEENYINAIDKIQEKFGPISILRASSLLESSTIKEREKFKNLI